MACLKDPSPVSPVTSWFSGRGQCWLSPMPDSQVIHPQPQDNKI